MLPMLGIAMTASAQVALTSTAGTPSATYTTVRQAFDAINNGTHRGDVTIALTGNTTESAPAVLNAAGAGAAAYTGLRITPSGGGARLIAGSVAGALLDFNGADNVVIDGLDDAGNSLVIRNDDVGASSTIRLRADASNNQFIRLTIEGAGTGSGTGVVLVGSGSVTGNDNNEWASCVVAPAPSNAPQNGILALSTMGASNSGNIITGCQIRDYFNASAPSSSGITIDTGNSGWTISNNRFYQSVARTFLAGNIHRGIQITGGEGHVVSGNVIGFANANGSGTYALSGSATQFIGMDLTVGGSTVTSVQGNTIAGIQLSTQANQGEGAGVLCGIRLAGGPVNVGNISPNIIGASTGVDQITANVSGSGALLTGIAIEQGTNYLVQGNIIGALSAIGSSSELDVHVRAISVGLQPSILTILNNTIGGDTAQSIRSGSLTTSGSTSVSGIAIATTSKSTYTIQGNTIRNLAALGSGNHGFARAIWAMSGPSVATLTIENNQISDVQSNATTTNVDDGLVAAAGIAIAQGETVEVRSNSISRVAEFNTGTAGTYAAGVAIAGTYGASVQFNRIYDVRNASTASAMTAPGMAAGVLVGPSTIGGSTLVLSNMIGLGAGQSTGTAFVGMHARLDGAPDLRPRFLFNTIHITGVQSASTPISSFGLHIGNFSSQTLDPAPEIRNNLIVNTRVGGAGKHYAIANNFGASAPASPWAPGRSDFNVLNAAPDSVGYWGTALSFADWKATSLSDAHSLSGVQVNFVNPSSDLHLNMGSLQTGLESGGFNRESSYNTDIDGQTRPGPIGSVRGGAKAPDIGADEFDGSWLDLVGPQMSHEPAPRTSSLQIRNLVVSIFDASGMPSDEPDAPRVYYRKGTGPYVSQSCQVQLGTTVNGDWRCQIVPDLVGGLAVGDTIEYFFVAQDLAGNIQAFPNAGFVGTSVNNVTVAPSNPSSYRIVGSFAGNYNVGVGETITSLTNPGGLFDRLNQSTVTDNVTVFITSDLLNETGEFGLNKLVEEGSAGTNTHLKIQPAGVPRTVVGSYAGPLIRLVGTSRVFVNGAIIDAAGGQGPGGNPATRQLTIRNNHPSPLVSAIAIYSINGDANQNTLINLNLYGSDPTISEAGIRFGRYPANSTIGSQVLTKILNCFMGRARFGLYAPSQIWYDNVNATITHNDLSGVGPDRIGQTGVFVRGGFGATISLNRIAVPEGVAGVPAAGIALGSEDMSATAVAAGAISGSIVEANDITSVSTNSGNSAVGIFLATSTYGNHNIANNMIRGVSGNATADNLTAGILVRTPPDAYSGYVRVSNNSVWLSGSQGAAVGISSALAVQGQNPRIDIKNNTFSNTQTATAVSASSFAVAMAATELTAVISDYNNFFSSGANAGHFRIGSLSAGSGTNFASLSSWQSAVADDAHAMQQPPQHISTDDLHLQDSSPLVSGSIRIFDLINDIDGQIRSPRSPSIGADEVVNVDLQVTKSNGVSELPDGAATVYAIEVSNAGPVDAWGVIVTDTLPSTLVNGSWSCVQAQSTASCPTIGAGTGNLNEPVSLRVGQHVHFDVMATVNSAVGGFANNTASAQTTSPQIDINPANNSATDQDPILGIGIFTNGFE
ncbi:DUF11 domain-containing protein [Ahniella affigens]|nr:DUF11 domain-containing protein [Ahniella affigens]